MVREYQAVNYVYANGRDSVGTCGEGINPLPRLNTSILYGIADFFARGILRRPLSELEEMDK